MNFGATTRLGRPIPERSDVSTRSDASGAPYGETSMRTNTIKHLATAVAFACTFGAQADTVSGQFALDGQALKPTEVAAFRIRDQFNPRLRR